MLRPAPWPVLRFGISRSRATRRFRRLAIRLEQCPAQSCGLRGVPRYDTRRPAAWPIHVRAQDVVIVAAHVVRATTRASCYPASVSVLRGQRVVSSSYGLLWARRRPRRHCAWGSLRSAHSSSWSLWWSSSSWVSFVTYRIHWPSGRRCHKLRSARSVAAPRAEVPGPEGQRCNRTSRSA